MKVNLTKVSLTIFVFFSFLEGIAQTITEQENQKVIYYSISQDKEVNLSSFETQKSNLIVRSGSKVVLEAPKSQEKAFYIWEGPNGMRTYKSTLIFENIKSKKSRKL